MLEEKCYSYVDLYLFELSRFDFTLLLSQHITVDARNELLCAHGTFASFHGSLQLQCNERYRCRPMGCGVYGKRA